MSKVFRVVILTLALVVVFAVAFGGWFFSSYPKHAEPPSVTVDASPEQIARGRYLVYHVSDCVGCHSQPSMKWAMPPTPGTEGQGGLPFDESLGVPGVVASRNITPDRETGIGEWTDGEIIRAIREGVNRDGEPLFPMMPYMQFRHMSDRDVQAVVAYLRTLEPRRNIVPKRRLHFPMNFIVRTMPQPLGGPVPHPDPSNRAEYGRYLVNIAGCVDCHTPRDEKGRPIESMQFAGGWAMNGPWGEVVTANLTPHPDNWIAQATREEFIGRFKAFASDDPSAGPDIPEGMNTIMPWAAFSGMTEDDLGAIYDFLRTLAPIEQKVVTFPRRQASLSLPQP